MVHLFHVLIPVHFSPCTHIAGKPVALNIGILSTIEQKFLNGRSCSWSGKTCEKNYKAERNMQEIIRSIYVKKS